MLCFPSGRYYQIYATLNNIDYKLRCHQWIFSTNLIIQKLLRQIFYVIKEI